MQEARTSGLVPPGTAVDVTVEHPQSEEHGDFATSLPLKLARSLRMSPLEIAQSIAPLIPTADAVERVWAEPPGFINFSLKPAWLASQLEGIIAEGDEYGNIDLGKGEPVQVEFVSVNPTGPIHVGHARGAVLGDALASVLSAAGYNVTREYYVNDAGSQMESFYNSLFIRVPAGPGSRRRDAPGRVHGRLHGGVGKGRCGGGGRPLPVHACRGGRERDWPYRPGPDASKHPRRSGEPEDTFRRVVPEYTLYDGGQYQRAMDALNNDNHLMQREGATWFVSTAWERTRTT